MPFKTIRGATYHYRWLHQPDPKQPTVVCLHGFTGSTQTFLFENPTLNYLAIDLIGHGKTAVYLHLYRYQLSALVEDLSLLLAELEIPSFYVLGYSMGARVALAWAIERPQGIEGVILEGGTAGIADEQQRHYRKIADRKLALRLLKEPLVEFVNYWEKLPLFASQQALSPEQKTKVRNERLGQNKFGLAMSLYSMGTGAQKNYWPMVTTIECPVLYLVGQKDTKFQEIGKQLTATKETFHYQMLADCGHCCHIEQPCLFEASVVAWINEIERGRTS
ncbi:2-succinyl-6-hydroxy-2,4-cyclohexadiene-1-carboxylate synthase [Enterococcus sp. DIV1298c]|uniref:2-succinyl-6-hydroxy-2, 4-cyclohexadiene-1-carboxylate synthase n=1 Tax=Enterococcus sp. DIV1298c TaxID=2815328 RepID=UPI001A921070|nr:2-succinyl-6-hydroxy-2,4-cyclohexadiene-1-carboxylate synthase [Enterococcus sp. DIV1298c]MBO0462189.1 2-succinyl-6-hydroxy-2,4-cyclohexadiene-1-carboxylate synthase [Enterococcus sp. DIV1298c]